MEAQALLGHRSMKYMYLLATVTVHGQVVAQEPGEKFQKNQQQQGTDLCWMLFTDARRDEDAYYIFIFVKYRVSVNLNVWSSDPTSTL